MTSEQQVTAPPKRYGSGTITHAVEREHPCDKPSAFTVSSTHKEGTVWTCDCGISFVLAYHQRDGWYWSRRATVGSTASATPYGTEPK